MSSLNLLSRREILASLLFHARGGGVGERWYSLLWEGVGGRADKMKSNNKLERRMHTNK